jgi:uncharacterized protein
MQSQNPTSFPPEVAKQLDFYVYRLLDPRNGETFYVGKGKGNRVFEHAAGALRLASIENEMGEDAVSLKIRRIIEIKNSGLDVVTVIHMHGIRTSETAYQVEAAVMDCYPGLTNRVGGHNGNELGVAHAEELIRRYSAKPLQVEHSLVLINVGRSYQEMNVYDAVRAAWRLNRTRAEKAQYVIAHGGGIVRGVFVAHRWMKVTPENFPNRPGSEEERNRWGFEGEEAPTEIQVLYMGKRVPPAERGAANPIRYLPG